MIIAVEKMVGEDRSKWEDEVGMFVQVDGKGGRESLKKENA